MLEAVSGHSSPIAEVSKAKAKCLEYRPEIRVSWPSSLCSLRIRSRNDTSISLSASPISQPDLLEQASPTSHLSAGISYLSFFDAPVFWRGAVLLQLDARLL